MHTRSSILMQIFTLELLKNETFYVPGMHGIYLFHFQDVLHSIIDPMFLSLSLSKRENLMLHGSQDSNGEEA